MHQQQQRIILKTLHGLINIFTNRFGKKQLVADELPAKSATELYCIERSARRKMIPNDGTWNLDVGLES